MSTAAADTRANESAHYWTPWLEVGGSWSSERSRAEATLWSPLWQSSNSLLFVDLRGKLFEQDVSEGNFALGFRHMLPAGWNFGVWGAFDIRRSTSGNVFHQAAFGLEALHPDWDLRLNGYVPLSYPKSSPGLAQVQLAGPQLLMTGGSEVPLHGIDAEAGFRLPVGLSNHEVRLYAGGFWFDAKEALREMAGPKARLEWRIDDVLPAVLGSRLTVEAGVRHDQVRDTVWELGARLRIPFGGGLENRTRLAALAPQARRMSERLERDTDIVSGPSAAEPVADAITGVRFDRVVYTADNGDSVTDASIAGGPNTLIIANGTISGPQEMQSHGEQTLQGGGSTIMVRGDRSGTLTAFKAPGAAATLSQPGNDNNLAVQGVYSHVAGLIIEGAGTGDFNHGIFLGWRNIAISQTSISDTGAAGIMGFNDHRDIRITDTTISRTGGFGIFLNDRNRNIIISNTTIIDSGGPGIALNADNEVRISGVRIDGAGGSGIQLFRDNRITVENTVLAGTFDDNGIHITNVDNVVNGAGNRTDGATFTAGVLCQADRPWTGTIVFDGTSITVANCP